MKSLFAKYIEARGGKEIIETEKGFATYYFINDGCYIEDIFVEEKYRKSGEASKMAYEIEIIAKERGCKKIYGTVCPQAKGSTDSLKVLLAYGFSLDSCTSNLIAMKKDIK